jgi:hypothetical protein
MPQISSNEIPFNEAQRSSRENQRMSYSQHSSSARFYNAATETAVPGRATYSPDPVNSTNSRSTLKHPALITLVLIILISFGVKASQDFQISELSNRFSTAITGVKESFKKYLPTRKKIENKPQVSSVKQAKKKEKTRWKKTGNPPQSNSSGISESTATFKK